LRALVGRGREMAASSREAGRTPFWRDGSRNLRPSIPAPDAGRDVPIYDDFRLVDLKRLGWSLFTPATYVNWCGHAQEFLPIPDGTARLVPIPWRRVRDTSWQRPAGTEGTRPDRACRRVCWKRVPPCSGNLRSRESQWRRRRRLRGTHASPFATPCTLYPKGSPS